MKYLCFLIAYLSICSSATSLEANTSDHRRIVGGYEAHIEDFPYMGALLLFKHLHCGVALISHDTVVTAAHCMPFFEHPWFLSVRLGSSQWQTGGQELSVKQVIIHPEYNLALLYDYDIAVLKLNGSVNFATANTIPLAAQGSQYLSGTPGLLSGWGSTSYPGNNPETLRAVAVPVYNQTQCRDAYKGKRLDITDRMICVGYQEGGRGQCKGDSGGPYVIDGKLVGIVSFSWPCALPGYPGVLASVPALSDWIKQYI